MCCLFNEYNMLSGQIWPVDSPQGVDIFSTNVEDKGRSKASWGGGYWRGQQDQRNVCGSVLNGRSGPHASLKIQGSGGDRTGPHKVEEEDNRNTGYGPTLERVRGTSFSETIKNRLKMV